MKNDRIDALVHAYRHSVEAWQTIQEAARERERQVREEIQQDVTIYLCGRFGLDATHSHVERLIRECADGIFRAVSGVIGNGGQ
jgi:hypothetical protein